MNAALKPTPVSPVEDIVAELRAGQLHPPVDRVFDLADGRAAFEHLASGAQFGKVVLRIA